MAFLCMYADWNGHLCGVSQSTQSASINMSERGGKCHISRVSESVKYFYRTLQMHLYLCDWARLRPNHWGIVHFNTVSDPEWEGLYLLRCPGSQWVRRLHGPEKRRAEQRGMFRLIKDAIWRRERWRSADEGREVSVKWGGMRRVWSWKGDILLFWCKLKVWEWSGSWMIVLSGYS
jgi:hypothetical protein